MNCKFVQVTLLLLLIIFTVTTQFSHAVEWSPDIRLTWGDPVRADFCPSIAQTNDTRIWIVWHSDRTGNNEIFYQVYNESLVHPWSSRMQLTVDPNIDWAPSIMETEDGKLWVLWSTDRTGNLEIFYKTSSDNGETWSSDMQLTYDLGEDRFPSITQLNTGEIMVVWDSDRVSSQRDLYYTISSNGGETWSSDENFTSNPDDDWDPAIAKMQDNTAWVVWVRNNDLFYKVYNESSWLTETLLVDDPEIDSHPSIVQLSWGHIWVVWDSDRAAEQTDIYYRFSPNYGGIWSANISLTADVEADAMPFILQTADETVWIAWSSSRLGNVNIYYRTDSEPDEHDVAIFSVTHNPSTTIVHQGANVTIEVVPQNQGLNPENHLQVHCYVNSTPIENQTQPLPPGQLTALTFTWNTTGFAYGNYTISAVVDTVPGEMDTTDNTYSNGKVLVTIPGDCNGDRLVDIFDIGYLSAHWYPGPPTGPLGYHANADINDDGAVDIFDIGITSANWGQSW